MNKLCMIYNFAQRYRTAIFRSIDLQWNCEWYFGKNTTDIKGMDISLLNHATEIENINVIGSWYYQKGITKLTKRKDLSTFFILGDPYCISNWYIAIKLKLSRNKKRLYFWTHGWYGKESRLTAWIKKCFFKMADGIFLYGNYARNLMIEEGFDSDKLFVIHNSLDHHKQVEIRKSMTSSDIFSKHFKNKNKTIIFIGRLTAVKRLDLLIEAIRILKTKGYNYNLVLVGDGSERSNLEHLVMNNNLEENVWFYGACYDEYENANLIYNADLCVAPGNVGLTAMHTMVFGTPVISHNDFKWQMPEFEAIKPGKTGAFFDKNNVDSLTQAISNWFVNNEDREAVRKECYDEIDNFWTPDFQIEVLKKNLVV